MTNKPASNYNKFKSNIDKAVNHKSGVLVIAIILLFITIIVVGLTIFFISLFNWPLATGGTLVLVALARVLYAGFTGR